MSIWTDLLIMRGHIATPTALALVTGPRPALARTPIAGADKPVRAAGPGVELCPEVHGHPLRVVGQLP